MSGEWWQTKFNVSSRLRSQSQSHRIRAWESLSESLTWAWAWQFNILFLMNFSCKILYFILMNFCCKIWCLLDGFISHWALCYVGWNVKIVSLFTHVLSVRKNSIPYLNSSRCPRIPNWGVDNTPPYGQLFLKLEVFCDMNPLKSKTSVGGRFLFVNSSPIWLI